MKIYKYNPRLNSNIDEKTDIRLLSKIVTGILIFCILACFLLLAVTSTYFNAEVEGVSMYPTINAAEKNEIAYYTKSKTPKIGDMIIVDYAYGGGNIKAIKRLIAKGGDTICYYDGSILVNGERLKEPYLDEAYQYLQNNPSVLSKCSYSSADEWKELGYTRSKNNFENFCEALVDGTIPQSSRRTEFFINFDTKYKNSIKKSNVLNTYVLTLPEGFAYFLGDNRAQSSDASALGPVEEKYIVAKVDFIAEQNSTLTGLFTKELFNIFS